MTTAQRFGNWCNRHEIALLFIAFETPIAIALLVMGLAK